MRKTRRKIANKPGRPIKTGGWSYLVRQGEIPGKLVHVRAYLADAREGLVRDIGGDEERLTAAQRILIDRTIGILGVLRTIEESLAASGVMQGGDLAPILKENYLGYQNTCRLNLLALGLNKRQADEPVDLGAYIADKDAEAGGGLISPPGTTSSDSPADGQAADVAGDRGAEDGKE